METETCTATKMRPTATGEIEVRCTKAPGHVQAGDERHAGATGVFPISWPAVVHYNPGWPEQVTPCTPGHFIGDLPRDAIAPNGEPESVTCPECREYVFGGP